MTRLIESLDLFIEKAGNISLDVEDFTEKHRELSHPKTIQFLRMIDNAVDNGIVSLKDFPIPADTVMEDLAEAHVFRFVPHIVTEPTAPEDLDIEPMGQPFDVVSIELVGAPLSIARPGTEEIDSYCMVSIDKPDRQYLVGLFHTEKRNLVTMAFYSTVATKLIAHYIERLSRASVAKERINEKRRFGIGKNRKLVKFRRVVYVRPKGQLYARAEEHIASKNLQWSHRWEVRGHWRTLNPETKGKNRHGEYVEKGRTWVVPYVKGPDTEDLIIKTRVVKGE